MGVYSATTEGEEALAAATLETVLQLRGGSVKSRLVEWGISFDGILSTDAPVVVRLLRQSTDGTASAASEVPWDPDDPAASVAALHSFTVEPTPDVVLATYEVHPQGGLLVLQYPPGREPIIDAAATSRLALDATAPAVVNVAAYMVWAEGG